MRAAAAAVATCVALATAAQAQSPADRLPREPGLIADPAVAPPETPAPVEPLTAPVPDGGPSFVLRGVTLEGATAVPDAELRPLWADLVGQEVTLATLQGLADRIGATYRTRGFVLSQAVLPAQEIADGVVRILVIEGFVDQVDITGGAANQQALAELFFAPVTEARPLRLSTLERAILLSRDSFGGAAETVLEPAPATFGAADLGVLIEPERPTGFVTADNRGSRLYGPLTLGAGGRAYNLLGLNERLDGLVAVAPEDASLAYAQAVMEVPLPWLSGTALDGGRLELSGNIARSNPDLSRSGTDDLTIVLDETNLRVGLIVPFIRTRSQNLFGRLGVDFQESESETVFGGPSSFETDRLTVLDLGLTWDRADRLGGVTLVEAGLRQGLDIAGARIDAEGSAGGTVDFTLATATLSRLQSLGSSRWALFGELIGQAAADVLPPSERFSLGDATIGRGYAPGNTSGDSGYGGRLELRRYMVADDFEGAVEAVEVYVFGDYGQAYDRSGDRDGAQWETLASAGIGARIDVRPWLTITPEIAQQLDGQATDTTDTGLETRAYLGVVARF